MQRNKLSTAQISGIAAGGYLGLMYALHKLQSDPIRKYDANEQFENEFLRNHLPAITKTLLELVGQAGFVTLLTGMGSWVGGCIGDGFHSAMGLFSSAKKDENIAAHIPNVHRKKLSN